MENVNEYIALDNDYVLVDAYTDIEDYFWSYIFKADADRIKAIKVMTKAIEDWFNEDEHEELVNECLADVIEDYLTFNGILDYEVDYEHYIQD